MKIVTGNLLDVTEGTIVHQVNCKRVAGHGLAKAIRDKWPDWYTHYLAVVPKLGEIDLFRPNGSPVVVCSFYSQNEYGYGRCFTSYLAFVSCLVKLQTTMCSLECQRRVHFPWKIGCGLAGGDWNLVQLLIEEAFPESIIVRRPQDQ